MNSYTLKFIQYLLGYRSADFPSYTETELKFLATLAIGKKCIVKFGVGEGTDAKVFCQNMEPDGKLYLVDPYFPQVKLEKILKFSFAEFIAKQAVKPYTNLVQFLKMTSSEASKALNLKVKADLIFIDFKHDYNSVLEDFQYWIPLLSKQGVIAFPNSRTCQNRPVLNPQSGALLLCNEIVRGKHGNWKIVDKCEWITVLAVDTRSKDYISSNYN